MSKNPPKWEPDEEPSGAPGRYILKHRKPVPCSDLIKWGKWLKIHFNKKIVRHTWFGKILISTVFLGLDHNYSGKGAPILFETMILHEDNSGDYQTRCRTWREALAMHKTAIEEFKNGTS